MQYYDKKAQLHHLQNFFLICLTLTSQNNKSTKRYNKFTRTCLYKLYLRIIFTKTCITSSRINILCFQGQIYIIDTYQYLALTFLSGNSQLSIHINLIFPLFFYQIPQKIAMLTLMTNTVLNVTYHHDNDLIIFLQYSPIGIS